MTAPSSTIVTFGLHSFVSTRTTDTVYIAHEQVLSH